MLLRIISRLATSTVTFPGWRLSGRIFDTVDEGSVQHLMFGHVLFFARDFAIHELILSFLDDGVLEVGVSLFCLGVQTRTYNGRVSDESISVAHCY